MGPDAGGHARHDDRQRADLPRRLHDPEWKVIDENRLAQYDGPVLLTSGEQSPPIFHPIEDRLAQLLPQAKRTMYAGAGHIPHVTHPEEYVAELAAFIESMEASRR